MTITWGSTTLYVAIGTWSPSQVGGAITEVELLPDPAALSSVCTVLQQGGKKRARVGANLFLTSMTDYNTLLSDMNAGTSRTLADGDTVNATYYIETLGSPTIHFTGHITTDIVFVEG